MHKNMATVNRCETCMIDFSEKSHLQLHDVTLAHHTKLAQRSSVCVHYCEFCNSQFESLTGFSRHLNHKAHRVALKMFKKSHKIKHDTYTNIIKNDARSHDSMSSSSSRDNSIESNRSADGSGKKSKMKSKITGDFVDGSYSDMPKKKSQHVAWSDSLIETPVAKFNRDKSISNKGVMTHDERYSSVEERNALEQDFKQETQKDAYTGGQSHFKFNFFSEKDFMGKKTPSMTFYSDHRDQDRGNAYNGKFSDPAQHKNSRWDKDTWHGNQYENFDDFQYNNHYGQSSYQNPRPQQYYNWNRHQGPGGFPPDGWEMGRPPPGLLGHAPPPPPVFRHPYPMNYGPRGRGYNPHYPHDSKDSWIYDRDSPPVKDGEGAALATNSAGDSGENAEFESAKVDGTLKLSLKASQIIDDIMKGGTGKNVKNVPGQSEKQKDAPQDKGTMLLDKAEKLCQELRMKRQFYNKEKERKDNRLKLQERRTAADTEKSSADVPHVRERSQSHDRRWQADTIVSHPVSSGFSDSALSKPKGQSSPIKTGPLTSATPSLSRTESTNISDFKVTSLSSKAKTVGSPRAGSNNIPTLLRNESAGLSDSTMPSKSKPYVAATVGPNTSRARRVSESGDKDRRGRKSFESNDKDGAKSDKDILLKLVNSPRSRKEQLEVAKMLNKYSKVLHQKQRPRLQLQTDSDQATREQALEMLNLEQLPDALRREIAQLMEEERLFDDIVVENISPQIPESTDEKSSTMGLLEFIQKHIGEDLGNPATDIASDPQTFSFHSAISSDRAAATSTASDSTNSLLLPSSLASSAIGQPRFRSSTKDSKTLESAPSDSDTIICLDTSPLKSSFLTSDHSRTFSLDQADEDDIHMDNTVATSKSSFFTLSEEPIQQPIVVIPDNADHLPPHSEDSHMDHSPSITSTGVNNNDCLNPANSFPCPCIVLPQSDNHAQSMSTNVEAETRNSFMDCDELASGDDSPRSLVKRRRNRSLTNTMPANEQTSVENSNAAKRQKMLSTSPNATTSTMDQVYDISLKEEEVHRKIEETQEAIEKLEELLKKTQDQLNRRKRMKQELQEAECGLRSKRLAILKGAVESKSTDIVTIKVETPDRHSDDKSHGENVKTNPIDHSEEVVKQENTSTENGTSERKKDGPKKYDDNRDVLNPSLCDIETVETTQNNVNPPETTLPQTTGQKPVGNMSKVTVSQLPKAENEQTEPDTTVPSACDKADEIFLTPSHTPTKAKLKDSTHPTSPTATGRPRSKSHSFCMADSVSRKEHASTVSSSTTEEATMQYVGCFGGEAENSNLLQELAKNFASLKQASYVFLEEEALQSDTQSSPSDPKKTAAKSKEAKLEESSLYREKLRKRIDRIEDKEQTNARKSKSPKASPKPNKKETKQQSPKEAKQITEKKEKSPTPGTSKEVTTETATAKSSQINGKKKRKTRKVRDQIRLNASHKEATSDSTMVEEQDTTITSSPSLRKKKKNSFEAKLVQEYLHATSSSDVEMDGLNPIKQTSMIKSYTKQASSAIDSTVTDTNDIFEALIGGQADIVAEPFLSQEDQGPMISVVSNAACKKVQPSEVNESMLSIATTLTEQRPTEDEDMVSVVSQLDTTTSTCAGILNDVLAAEGRNFYEGHSDSVTCLKIWASCLLTGSSDGSVRKFEIQTQQSIGTMEAHEAVNCIHVSAAGGHGIRVFAGGKQGRLSVYNFKNCEKMLQKRCASPITCLAETGGILYIGMLNGNIIFYDLKSNKHVNAFHFSDKEITSLSVGKEGGRSLLLAAAADCSISIRDATSSLLMRVLEGHTKPALVIQVMNNLVYSGGLDKTMQVHNINTGDTEWMIWVNSPVSCMCVEGTMLAVGCQDGTVTIYDTVSHQVVCSYMTEGRVPLTAMALKNAVLYLGDKQGMIQSACIGSGPLWKCRVNRCSLVYGLRGDLLQHVKMDHLKVTTGQQLWCLWQGCGDVITADDAETHMYAHITKDAKVARP